MKKKSDADAPSFLYGFWWVQSSQNSSENESKQLHYPHFDINLIQVSLNQ
jgi:hypothetical protein